MPISHDKAQEIIATACAAHDDPEDAFREAYYQFALRASVVLDALPRNPGYRRAVDRSFRLLAYTGHFRSFLRTSPSGVGIALGPTLAEHWFSLMDIWIELLEFVHDHHEQLLGGWPTPATVAEDLQALHEAHAELADRYFQNNSLIISADLLMLVFSFTDQMIRSVLGDEQRERFNEEFNPVLPHLRLFQRQLEAADGRMH